MTINRSGRFYSTIFVWMLLLPILSLSVNAQTQRFEVAYGGNTCVEKGFRGVEPVDLLGGCCDGGYIAVGYSTEDLTTTQCGDENVYVVRVNNDGTHMFEFVYDIGGGIDKGVSIRELPDGFIVTGTTQPNVFGSTTDIFLLKIDCEGDIVFSRTYGTQNVNDFASDVIVAEHGNGATTNPGDFIISGWSDRAFPNLEDGLLIRTTANGTLIWNRTYNVIGTDPDQHDDRFESLIEAGTTGVGDIVAVGHTSAFSFDGPDFFGIQALVVRVNGNTGNIGAAPQGVAHYGGSQDDRFDAVRELSTAAEGGRLVFAGSTSAVGVEDIYLVKTAADPNTMLAQNKVDQAVFVAGSGEVALGIVEVTTPGLAFCPLGDLAVVGRTAVNCPNIDPTVPERHDNALLLHVSAATLQVIDGLQFGNQMECVRNEIFYSVKDVGHGDPGFILCGSTVDNPAPIAPPPPLPDPSDLYLVKTDGTGATGCEEEWNFLQLDPEWEEDNAGVSIASPITSRSVRMDLAAKNLPEVVCEPDDDDDRIEVPPPGGGRQLLEGEPGFSESGSLSLPLSGRR